MTDAQKASLINNSILLNRYYGLNLNKGINSIKPADNPNRKYTV